MHHPEEHHQPARRQEQAPPLLLPLLPPRCCYSYPWPLQARTTLAAPSMPQTGRTDRAVQRSVLRPPPSPPLQLWPPQQPPPQTLQCSSEAAAAAAVHLEVASYHHPYTYPLPSSSSRLDRYNQAAAGRNQAAAAADRQAVGLHTLDVAAGRNQEVVVGHNLLEEAAGHNQAAASCHLAPVEGPIHPHHHHDI